MKNKKNPEQAAEPQENEATQAAEAEAQPEEPRSEAPETGSESAEEAREATVEEWQAALETAVKQRDEYLDSLRRSQAEFQNFRRRNQTARSDGYQEGVREAVTAVLPALDNLERALDAAKQAGESDNLTSGVEMTLNMLLEGLKKFGLEEIPALGEDFDPELHNAVMKEPAEEPGKVLAVFQKGYRMKDKILRYAMVKVSSEE